jgi:hypothetical protein
VGVRLASVTVNVLQLVPCSTLIIRLCLMAVPFRPAGSRANEPFSHLSLTDLTDHLWPPQAIAPPIHTEVVLAWGTPISIPRWSRALSFPCAVGEADSALPAFLPFQRVS